MEMNRLVYVDLHNSGKMSKRYHKTLTLTRAKVTGGAMDKKGIKIPIRKS